MNETEKSTDHNPIEVREEIIRCAGTRSDGKPCNKFLTKIKYYFSISEDIRKIMSEKDIPISLAVKGIEIKIGLETKCNRCKEMDYQLKVI